MSNANPIRRALISVSDKRGLAALGHALKARDVEILSTGGTAKLLESEGIATTEVADYTGFPEMLDGRVKTLHPKVHGGLLGRRDLESHQEQMKAHDIAPIDLVVVNLYPFEQVAAKDDAKWDDLIENIDIGGPSMLRSAAKNHAAVTVVCDPDDYADVIAEIKADGATTLQTRQALALKVFARTAAYDAAIAETLAAKHEAQSDADASASLPPVIRVGGPRLARLRYGENPHQGAGVYATHKDALDLASAAPLQGKALSYNNLLDADAALFSLRCLVDHNAAAKTAPGTVVIKHGTPCGAALGDRPLTAWQAALSGDPVSAFGGIVATSHTVDEEAALAMAEVFLEVILAPDFTDEARAVFAKKKNLRLMAMENLVTAPLPAQQIRSIAGGLLVQDHDRPFSNIREANVVTKRQPTDEEWAALDVAFRMCTAVRSNAITFAQGQSAGKGPHLIGAGGGQTSRVDAAKIAVEKATTHNHSLSGSAMGSDAFFPFADGVLVGLDAGATAVAQPGGSKRDDEVIAACDERGATMVFTGERHFRH